MNPILRQWYEAAHEPRQQRVSGEGEPAAAGFHHAYLNEVLQDYYCHACGAEWPCLPYRQATSCKCSHHATVHEHGTGQCWSTACGCQTLRLRGES